MRNPLQHAAGRLAAFAFLLMTTGAMHAQFSGLGGIGGDGGASNANPANRRSGGLGVGSYDTKERPIADHVVAGTVLDPKGVGVKGALVYLKDEKTAKVRSMKADDKGKFRFPQLSRTVDYKLWAETGEKKTPVKTISSFDNRDEINRDLSVE